MEGTIRVVFQGKYFQCGKMAGGGYRKAQVAENRNPAGILKNFCGSFAGHINEVNPAQVGNGVKVIGKTCRLVKRFITERFKLMNNFFLIGGVDDKINISCCPHITIRLEREGTNKGIGN